MPPSGNPRQHPKLATSSVPDADRELSQLSSARPVRFRGLIYSASARERISDKDALGCVDSRDSPIF